MIVAGFKFVPTTWMEDGGDVRPTHANSEVVVQKFYASR